MLIGSKLKTIRQSERLARQLVKVSRTAERILRSMNFVFLADKLKAFDTSVGSKILDAKRREKNFVN